MIDLSQYEVWFLTGSQPLYGQDVLEQVDVHSKKIAAELDESDNISLNIVFKPVLSSQARIKKVFREANAADKCVGVITWMHTFSPAQMWIPGLKILEKPILHLHTQFNKNIPYDTIDMDFMNLNQSAHGGREYGFILSRIRKDRKVVVGHWKEKKVEKKIDKWSRAACAWSDWQDMKIARFGDNMRNVAVTEGDKVEANIKLGYSVAGYGVGDLVEYINSVKKNEVESIIADYRRKYNIKTDDKQSIEESARVEAGLRSFLEQGNFKAFTTNFENLTGLRHLPGLTVQRLMADGYGFGAEGDWKTAALLRAMKVMAAGLQGGTSFMEDYTYDLEPDDMKVLGAHMLEVCPSLAASKPELDVYPLDIGGKANPARLIFNTTPGQALRVAFMDMGNRFRMVLNTCEVIKPDRDLPKLPVARVIWKPQPDLETSATAWIHAGGAHHNSFSMALEKEHLEDFATISGVELLIIDNDTNIRDFKKEIRLNELYYSVKGNF